MKIISSEEKFRTPIFWVTQDRAVDPDGFEIELVAGPPLVNRPIMADFDEQGRLYVADSAGVGDWPCRSEIAAKLMTETTRRDLVLTRRSLGNREDGCQDIYNSTVPVQAGFGLPAFGSSRS